MSHFSAASGIQMPLQFWPLDSLKQQIVSCYECLCNCECLWMHVHTSLSYAVAQGTQELQRCKSKSCAPGGLTLQVLIAGAISAQLQNCGPESLPTLQPGHARLCLLLPQELGRADGWPCWLLDHPSHGSQGHTQAQGEANKLVTCL